MHEPTVLDYVKSKLFFWRGEKIEIPSAGSLPAEPTRFDETGADHGVYNLEKPETEYSSEAPDDMDAPDTPQVGVGVEERRATWVWPTVRVLLPLLSALIAQRFLEPPGRSLMLGVFFYTLATAGLVWASYKGDWKLTEIPTPGWTTGWEVMALRPLSLGAAIVLGATAFAAFGDNRFTLFNLALWGLSMGFFMHAFWQFDPNREPIWARWKTAGKKFLTDGISVSPWTLLVLAVFGLTVFFRFYMLNEIPGEMFSDHAEKLFDVSDVLDGEHRIFFPRNTGREAFQMYLTAAMAVLFDTGLSFMSLKLGTALAGAFTLPFIYLTGKEIGNRRTGLFAMLLAGVAYWPNVISRVALRFTLYPFFFAPTLYFLVRGFQRRSRNDFIWAGIFLGLGLHGYSPSRFVPLLVLAAFGLYMIHSQSKDARKQSVYWLALTGFTSVMVFLPLLRYMLSDPGMFSYRAMTRMTGMERELPGPAWEIFLKNTWNAITMFFWDNGEIWVHSVTHRPALDVVSAALLFMGIVLLIVRYVRKRNWLDIFWLVSIPILMMPSILSLAFPAENPSLNRTGAAMVPVFLIVATALEGFFTSMKARLTIPHSRKIVWGMVVVLLAMSINQNYDLVFRQFKTQFDLASWNTSELGGVIRQFADSVGDEDQAWVVPYAHWVDTRLVGFRADVPLRDYALWPDQLEMSLDVNSPKMFLFKPEDETAAEKLMTLYPDGVLNLYPSALPGKDFYIFMVP